MTTTTNSIAMMTTRKRAPITIIISHRTVRLSPMEVTTHWSDDKLSRKMNRHSLFARRHSSLQTFNDENYFHLRTVDVRWARRYIQPVMHLQWMANQIYCQFVLIWKKVRKKDNFNEDRLSSCLFSIARTRSSDHLQRRTRRWRTRSIEQVEESVIEQWTSSFETGWYCSLVITCCHSTARKYAFNHQRIVGVTPRQWSRARGEATRTIPIRLASIAEEHSRSAEYAGRSG